ncbi:MAG: endoglycoceramidase [Acidimicrobiales bacterium]|nr:endoglycoceramidase [Acidimicrobiales bacterium]
MRRSPRVVALVVLVAAALAGCSSSGPAPVPSPACPSVDTSLRVERRSGRAELVDRSGAVVRLRAANVRFERSGGRLPEVYAAAQLQSVRRAGIDTIRVAVRWVDLQPRPGALDPAFAARLDLLVARAGDVGLRVLLDPIHVGGGDAQGQFLPRWANGGRPVTTDEVLPTLERQGQDYLVAVLRRWCRVPAVIGLDLVNEPREDRRSGVDLAARNRRLVALYHRWIVALRGVDGDALLALEPYYGLTLIDPALVASLATTGGNLVWAPHDYGTGGSGDGYTATGYPQLDAFDAGQVASRGRYPTGGPARAARRRDQAAHLASQDRVARAAGMPLLVGEFGIPSGWTGRRELLCDKVALYRQRGWSWAVWELDHRIDPGYGLWDPGTTRWLPFAAAVAPAPAVGTNRC